MDWLKDWLEYFGPYYKRNWKAYCFGIGSLMPILAIAVLFAFKPKQEEKDLSELVDLCIEAAFGALRINLEKNDATIRKYGAFSASAERGHIVVWKDEYEERQYKCVSSEYRGRTTLASFEVDGEEMIDLVRLWEQKK